MKDDENIEMQFFGLKIIKTLDKKTGKGQLHLETSGEGIGLPEALIYIEGWVEKIKEQIQHPITSTLSIRPRCESCRKVILDEPIMKDGKPYCKDCSH